MFPGTENGLQGALLLVQRMQIASFLEVQSGAGQRSWSVLTGVFYSVLLFSMDLAKGPPPI